MPILKTFSIFAKYWEPGRVKTRLARTIGEVAAARIYQHFLRVTVNLGQNWSGQKVIGYAPPERKSEFRNFAPGWELIPQVAEFAGTTADLGIRMKLFFETLFESMSPNGQDDHRVVLIGSDTPHISLDTIEEAFRSLENHEVVVGPSLDGGYYLVGARNQTPDIFEGISWSSEKVFEQTKNQLDRKGYRYHLLAPLADIDDENDLRQLTAGLEKRLGNNSLREAELEWLLQVIKEELSEHSLPSASPASLLEDSTGDSSERKRS